MGDRSVKVYSLVDVDDDKLAVGHPSLRKYRGEQHQYAR